MKIKEKIQSKINELCSDENRYLYWNNPYVDKHPEFSLDSVEEAMKELVDFILEALLNKELE